MPLLWLAPLAMSAMAADGAFFAAVSMEPVPPPVQVVAPIGRYEPEPPPIEYRSSDSEWSTGIVVGIPLGVRFAKPLERSPIWFEGFGGLLVIFPAIGAGFRTELPMAHGRDNCLLVRPGVDLYLLANPYPEVDRQGFFAAMAADCDLVFRHRFSRRFSGDFGLKLGMGVPIVHRGGLFPIAGLFGGFEY